MSKNEFIILLLLVTTGIFLFKLWGLYTELHQATSSQSQKNQSLPPDLPMKYPWKIERPGK